MTSDPVPVAHMEMIAAFLDIGASSMGSFDSARACPNRDAQDVDSFIDSVRDPFYKFFTAPGLSRYFLIPR